MRCAKLTTLLCSTLALGCVTDEAPDGDVEALSGEHTEPLHLQREPASDGSLADGSATLSFDLAGLSLVASAHVDVHVLERGEGRVVQRVVVIDEDGAEISLGDVEVPALGERLRIDVTDALNDALASGSLELELRPLAGPAVRWSSLADEPLFRPRLVVEPLRDRFRRVQRPVADSYIVVLDDDVVAREDADAVADALSATYGAEEEHRYRSAIRGMGVVMSEASAIAMAGDPRVAYVEEAATVAASPVGSRGFGDLVAAPDDSDPLAVQQAGSGWALDRIDQHNMPLNYVYDYTTTGAGVEIHVLDAPVSTTHADLSGRVTVRSTIPVAMVDSSCAAHGTQVASVAAGTNFGVAKQAQIHSWQIHTCNPAASFSTAGIIAIIDQINATAAQRAVVNFSAELSGTSTALDTAVNNSIASGLVWVIAAGNDGLDACNRSPQRVAAATVVGASAPYDQMAAFSSVGPCVDLFAPGQNVPVGEWGAPDPVSGTSYSAPIVSGALARVLGTYSTMTQGQANTLLSVFSTSNALAGVPAGTLNRLLWIPGSGQAPDQNPAHPMDTNNDGFVSPSDSLVIINYINAGGAPVPPAGAPFLDVNGDGFVAPGDALLVINYLNAG